MLSVRCPYLLGHVEAALKPHEEQESGDDARGLRDELPRKVQLCLEHASTDAIGLLVRYLYTDEVPLGVSGGILDALASLAKEVMLPR